MGEADRGHGCEIEIRLLGPVDVLREGRPVGLGGAKPRALLAALALEPGHVVSVDRLVEALWPTAPPDTAAHAVQVYVSQLRSALGSATIATRPPGYALELEPGCVDAQRFERMTDKGRASLTRGDAVAAAAILRAALALWRGPALADLLYEPFAQTEIGRLEELRLVALEARIDADLALGQHLELVRELETLTAEQPLREATWRRLMMALYRSGRQADALAAYRRARAELVEELGIEPGPELKELEAAILRQDESLLPDSTAAPAMQFRRLLTVLAVHVRGTLALAEALDAEAVAQIVRLSLDAIAAAITRHGGTTERRSGDSVTAAFGFPVSHEDHALRAARAALEIGATLAAVSEQVVREHGLALEASIGLEAGEVVARPTEPGRRFVEGEVVGLAAALAGAAAPTETLVGEVAGRMIDHAAVLEPLEELSIEGRRRPLRPYRLLAIAATAPAFERRLDAPFVGRTREVAALRRSLDRAVEETASQAVLVLGAAGMGKSRLAAEFATQTSDVTTLAGRCVSYGDGMTYWPLREILEQGGDTAERRELLSALEAEPPPPAGELALAFRRFCELLARTRPLVLVFDDLQWAEPTFLELVEHVAEKTQGPVLVLCLAREELVEDRPAFLSQNTRADRLALGALSDDETDAVLEGLGGAALETDQRGRVVEAAEGNPLFLEQLLALTLEGGAERTLPPTIQALLAARLDRLGPGERAVLERGAVVGREFTAEDVAYLLDPAAAHTAPAHLHALSTRGFVRPQDRDAFAFRHVLVQEAVYRATPKRLRAELHARFVNRLGEGLTDLLELDELIGSHLERAHDLRVELHEIDERTHMLGREAGRRLGAAGVRALRRGDMHAATSLLARSTTLLAADDPLRRELLCELALALVATGAPDRAKEALTEATSRAREAGDARIESRARIELEYIRLRREPQRTADALLDAATEGIPVFERFTDRRALGRAWLLAGFVHGGHRGNHRAWEEAAERALKQYRLAGWPISSCVGEIAAALYWGPARVDDAVHRCDLLLQDERLDLPGNAYLRVFLGGLVAQRHEFDRARELAQSAKATLEELGMQAATDTYCLPVLGEIELLAGDPAASEQILRDLCARLERARDFSHLASRASDLAEALLKQGLIDQADEWTLVAERYAAPDDLDAQMLWRPVRAQIHALRGRFDLAEAVAREGVRLTERTDALNRRARAHVALADALLGTGKTNDASTALQRAIELYDEKGNLVGLTRARAARAETAAA